MKQITIRMIDPQFHTAENFREQIFTLQVKDVDDDSIYFYRSHFLTCQPGAAGFDVDRPGVDTQAGWEALDRLIEEEKVRGIFHTHPSGVLDFSPVDWATQIALARANGKRYLWYGVQALDSENAHFICMHMIGGGQVLIYDLGFEKSDIFAPIIKVPLPPKLDEIATGVWQMDY